MIKGDRMDRGSFFIPFFDSRSELLVKSHDYSGGMFFLTRYFLSPRIN